MRDVARHAEAMARILIGLTLQNGRIHALQETAGVDHHGCEEFPLPFGVIDRLRRRSSAALLRKGLRSTEFDSIEPP